MSKKKICIIIPAYNEEESIGFVISSLRKLGRNYRLIVVDDGSTDNTRQVVKKSGTNIISHPKNIGVGGAIRTGIGYALENKYEIAVQIDADGQHDPQYIPRLVRVIERGFDVVIGSRFIKKTQYQTPVLRRAAIILFSILIRIICRRKILDPTSGYRAFSKKTMAFLVNNYPDHIPEPQTTANLLKQQFKIKEIPVEMKKRIAGKSSLTLIKGVYFTFAALVNILVESRRDRKAKNITVTD